VKGKKIHYRVGQATLMAKSGVPNLRFSSEPGNQHLQPPLLLWCLTRLVGKLALVGLLGGAPLAMLA
jgi:hypothetical protein